jgi:hypothetical protein
LNFEFSRIPKKCFWNITGYDIDPPCWIWWHKMKVWHPWQKKKLKSWEPFRSYHLNSPANSANFAWFLVKVVVAPKRPPGFWIFTCLGCRIFILCEIHCYLCPPKSWHNNSCLGSVGDCCNKGMNGSLSELVRSLLLIVFPASPAWIWDSIKGYDFYLLSTMSIYIL